MKYCKLSLVIFASALLCAAGGRAVTAGDTGCITGKVVAAGTDTALAYVNVVVLGTNLGATSLADGTFVIDGVPPGVYTVKAMMMGYKAVEKKNVRVETGKTTRLHFALDQTIVMRTQEIVVTGKKKPGNVSPSEARPVATSTKLEELAVDDALDAVTLGAGKVRRGDELHVRGGRSGKRQFQIDDRPVNDPLGGSPITSSDCVTPQLSVSACKTTVPIRAPQQPCNTESYDRIYETEFLEALDNPYSTFSIDVDAASYSNTRRFIEHGLMPPADAVRIEELVNYFSYDYPEPADGRPFSITVDAARCPWDDDHRLVRIGLQGRHIDLENAPPNNLVFLLDVSGSMSPANKLPLLIRSFNLLVDNLRKEDRVAIVVYAGAAGLVLESTPGDQKEKIQGALNRLWAGGTTAGGAGIRLAYKVAEENFIEDGNNRVILATDGDFNTGVSSDAEMIRLIEEKRESGVFISVLGFGEANLKDSKMEKIADHGNGHYAYIDGIFEGRRVMVDQMSGTLYTIAKDVKIQVEFNPAKVKSYRLIGYENRMLKKEDFDDDKKDAGEIGAGHSVTALYEIEPAGEELRAGSERNSKYTLVSVAPGAFDTDEMLTVRFRYQAPGGGASEKIVQTLSDHDVRFEDAPDDLRFAAAVAEWGMLLRDSEFKGQSSYDHVLRAAKNATGDDEGGYRHEFVRLVAMSKEVAKQ